MVHLARIAPFLGEVSKNTSPNSTQRQVFTQQRVDEFCMVECWSKRKSGNRLFPSNEDEYITFSRTIDFVFSISCLFGNLIHFIL
jgi:hypothetical protein